MSLTDGLMTITHLSLTDGLISLKTRMHSSGMRTSRLLTVSQHALGVGVCTPACTGQGVCVSQHALGRGWCVSPSMHWAGGCIPACTGQGVSAQGMSAWRGLPRGWQTPSCGQTDICENMTFANFVCGR